MLSQEMAAQTPQIQIWPIERLIEYARNPRKNDAAVDRMCGSIREFGFKIPCLVRSDGELVDGHLRLKAARKLGITEIPVILCDEWTPAQVKAFRLMVNRSVTWADWDNDRLAQELADLKNLDFDLALTGVVANTGYPAATPPLPTSCRAPVAPQSPFLWPATLPMGSPTTRCGASTPGLDASGRPVRSSTPIRSIGLPHTSCSQAMSSTFGTREFMPERLPMA